MKIEIGPDDWAVKINIKNGNIEMSIPKRKSYGVKEMFFVLAGLAKVAGSVSSILDKMNETDKKAEK